MIWPIRIAATLGLIGNVLTTLANAADPLTALPGQPAKATARVTRIHGYDQAIVLTGSHTRAVLCPQVGGRVFEFSVDGKDAMFLDDAEKTWQPGKPTPSSAGRFDYGPELTVIPHPTLWSGEWSGELTGT